MKYNFYSPYKRSVIKSALISFVLIIFSAFLLNTSTFGATTVITVSSFQFTPNNVSVAVGDSIKWQWIDGNHTTTSTSVPQGALNWDSPMTSSNQTFIYVVTVAGTYDYQCTPHSSIMQGSFTASAGSGSVLLTENFDYPAGDSLVQHGWVYFSGNVDPILVTAPGLTYPGYPQSGIGNAATVLDFGNDNYKDLSAVDSTDAIYTSFMVNVTSAASGGNYFFALLPPTSTSFYTARFYAKDEGGLKFGVSKGSASQGDIVYTTGTYNPGTTYLAVVKYQYNTPGGTDAETFVYLFESGMPATEPSVPTIGPVTGTAPDNPIGRIALRQGSTGSSPVVQVDGFRVGKTWSDIATTVTNISNNIADGYSLSQNYPNPFNPNTTIKFDIAGSGLVNLKIYNSLGKEVSSIINQNLSRGSYSTDFNGGNLSSGVYYYRLTFTGDNNEVFTDTKKLILLK